MGHINIEIKAKCSAPEKIREILKSREAVYIGRDHQIDTYFRAKFGRLKLREGGIENYLIYYDREDKIGPKQSNIILFKTYPKSSLKEILAKSLGILAVVAKKREVYCIDNVKFHIDAVKNLGTFIEIEAIDEKGTIGKEKLLEQCNFFLRLFRIQQEDLVPVSYSDLLLNSKNRAKLH